MSWEVHCHSKRKEWALIDREMNVISLVYKFLLSKKEEGYKSNSLRAYAYDLKHLYVFLEYKKIDIENFKSRNIGEFRTWMLKPKEEKYIDGLYLHRNASVCGSTWNRLEITLGLFVKWLEINDYKLIVSSLKLKESRQRGVQSGENKSRRSVSGWKIKETAKAPEYILPEERKLIRSSLSYRDTLIFDFIYFSGMRIGEVFSLKKTMFPPRPSPDKVLDLKLPQSLDDGLDRQTKTGARIVYIPNALYQRLAQYVIFKRGRASHDKLFTTTKNSKGSKKGSALLPDSFRQNLALACAKFGFAYTPHDLRHTIATDLLGVTGDIRLAQDVLGHKSVNTTQKYTHPLDEDVVSDLSDVYEDLYNGLLEVY